jgi:hypothetical protein
MELIVKGLDAARDKMNKDKPYVHLWGRYVCGFRPWQSCIASFQTKKEKAVTTSMKDGTYPLLGLTELFYLCGVGQNITAKSSEAMWRRYTNVHLAVRKKPGSTASLTSAYGVTFTISDAERIAIEPLPSEISTYLNANPAILNPNGEPGDHRTHCKNFRFGWQVFEATQDDCRMLSKGEVRDSIIKPRPAYEQFFRA